MSDSREAFENWADLIAHNERQDNLESWREDAA